MIYYLVLGVILIVSFLLFMIQNTSLVWVYFLNLRFQEPLSVILLGALLFGVVISILVAIPFLIKRKPKKDTSETGEKQ